MELNREQIIKALECWASGNPCEGSCCPLFEISPDTCDRWIGRNSLALIKKLTEENERLRKDNERYAELEQGWIVTGVKKVKADTVRKMQERLHERKVSYGNTTFRVVHIDDIDQIAKEMVEGGK